MEMRSLLIKSILATDMQLHFKYMGDLGNLQENLHYNKGTDGWADRKLEEYKTLACGLLIKCADISNVVSGTLTSMLYAELIIVGAPLSDSCQMVRHPLPRICRAG